MATGANSGWTVIQTAMRRWQAWRGQARRDPPPADVAARRIAEAVLARADVISAREQVHRDMLRMMWYFGIDPGRVPPRLRDALRDAEQVCAHCLAVGRCQHWFHGPLRDDAPRAFCPNAELYDEIARAQRQAPDADEPPAT